MSGQDVERREALLAVSGAAASVANAVGARAVPRHANEKAAVMAKVRGPPILGIGHQGVKVLDHRVEVEALEFLSVVERLAERIGGGGMLMENLKVQLVWPPLPVGLVQHRVRDRAFAGALVICLFGHAYLRSWLSGIKGFANKQNGCRGRRPDVPAGATANGLTYGFLSFPPPSLGGDPPATNSRQGRQNSGFFWHRRPWRAHWRRPQGHRQNGRPRRRDGWVITDASLVKFAFSDRGDRLRL